MRRKRRLLRMHCLRRRRPAVLSEPAAGLGRAARHPRHPRRRRLLLLCLLLLSLLLLLRLLLPLPLLQGLCLIVPILLLLLLLLLVLFSLLLLLLLHPVSNTGRGVTGHLGRACYSRSHQTLHIACEYLAPALKETPPQLAGPQLEFAREWHHTGLLQLLDITRSCVPVLGAKLAEQAGVICPQRRLVQPAALRLGRLRRLPVVLGGGVGRRRRIRAAHGRPLRHRLRRLVHLGEGNRKLWQIWSFEPHGGNFAEHRSTATRLLMRAASS